MRKWLNRALAVLFIAFLCTVFCVTMVQHGRMYAYGFFKSYKEKLPKNPTILDNIEARIYKLNGNANERLFLRDEMRVLNARFQSLLGKDIYDVGGKDTVRLANGAYYDMFTQKSTYEKMEELIDFSIRLEEEMNIPTAFVYCHGGVYEESLLPEKYRPMDDNNAFADEFIEAFKKAGISVTDSRVAYRTAGLTPDQAIFNSDIHWTHRMALETAAEAVRNLNRDFDLGLDETALDYERFVDEVHKDIFKGEIAQRLGLGIVDVDDIHLLYPAYDTHIEYTSEKTGVKIEKSGSFSETVVDREKMNIDSDDGYSTTAYYIYGDYLARLHTINKDAADKKILIFKDSYGTPVSAYFTLVAGELIAIDLRSTNESIEAIVREIQPDVVIFAYSQQMLRKFDYVIAE
ncbi:MAG: hypothetical protein E7322_04410 [Clostridiales bacterium]|nr:hypothetical protein [Clostridiales bacterium]